MADLAEAIDLFDTTFVKPDKIVASASMIPKNLALIAENVADASRAVAKAEDEYRAWRAITTYNLTSSGRSKAPEWKVRARVDADPAYINHKRGILELYFG